MIAWDRVVGSDDMWLVICNLIYPRALLVLKAVSSATTSTLVINADEIPQCIEGLVGVGAKLAKCAKVASKERY